MRNLKRRIRRIGRAGRGRVWAMLILLTGCVKNTGGDFCMIYAPIRADYKNDTLETARQIDWNNAAWDELCAR